MKNVFSGLNDLKDKKILVIGLGKSGISVLRKLSGIPAIVSAVDTDPLLELENQVGFVKKHKDFRLEVKLDEKANENIFLLDGIDLVITSPGISHDNRLLQHADNLARIRINRRDWEAAQNYIDKARQKAQASRSTMMDDRLVEVMQVRYWLARRELAPALQWARKCGFLDRSPADELVMTQ